MTKPDIDYLRSDIVRIAIANLRLIDHLKQQLAAAQARIDELMLEYCPDEMTAEQVEEWGNHQRAVKESK
jgi:uncharacterized protein involved in exopolysaccharide biosynthesis